MMALAFAVAGALGYGIGSIAQAAGARRATGTVRALGHPLYLAGLGCDLLAWLASLIALRTLPVYQVQAVLAGSLAVTVVAARIVLSARIRPRDMAAVAVTVLALGVLAAASGPQDDVRPSMALRYALVTSAVLLACAGWLATRGGSVTSARRAAVCAALAGLAYGGAALCARALALPAPGTGLRGVPTIVGSLATEPLTWALAVFGVTGTLLYAFALQHGQVGPVTAVLWIAEVLAPSAVGVAVLHDTVRPGWAPYAALAVLATTAAAAVLATAPATATATAEESES
ncbi:hypothetical protein [Dactylosporangium sp. NPDC051484]|uniref:hypothetical protein n=1 Tax=Dactylosporangium sp. NPDC051484 TaxID=3154942 RepID=UPI00344B20FF